MYILPTDSRENVQRCTTVYNDSTRTQPLIHRWQGWRVGGNERQTTERRCLNPPTAIRPGLNTAHPHISKGQGRYKGGLVLQKAWPGLCLKKRLNEEETPTPWSLNIPRIPFHLKFTEEEGWLPNQVRILWFLQCGYCRTLP